MHDQEAVPLGIAAYALWWGMFVAIGRKHLLEPQEVMDGMDAALHWLETNQTLFADQASVEAARAIVEKQMGHLRGRTT
jgi:hypothetical protein